MLKIKRRPGQKIIIDDGVEVTFMGVEGTQALLGFEFKQGHTVWREEVWKDRTRRPTEPAEFEGVDLAP